MTRVASLVIALLLVATLIFGPVWAAHHYLGSANGAFALAAFCYSGWMLRAIEKALGKSK